MSRQTDEDRGWLAQLWRRLFGGTAGGKGSGTAQGRGKDKGKQKPPVPPKPDPGDDFSDVEIHKGKPAEMEPLNAPAEARGDPPVLPEEPSADGSELIGHELAHTVQGRPPKQEKKDQKDEATKDPEEETPDKPAS